MYLSMWGWMDGWTDDGCMHAWMGGWVDACISWMYRWLDGPNHCIRHTKYYPSIILYFQSMGNRREKKKKSAYTKYNMSIKLHKYIYICTRNWIKLYVHLWHIFIIHSSFKNICNIIFLKRNCRELCRKDLLIKNLKRQKRRLHKQGEGEEAQAYNFWPTSFVLPVTYLYIIYIWLDTVMTLNH